MSLQLSEVSSDIQQSLSGCIASAGEVLGLQATDPSGLAEEVDQLIVACQRNAAEFEQRFPGENLGVLLGVAWGTQLVNAFGWSWKQVSDDEDADAGKALAVVSADQAIAIYPIDFVQFCLENPTVDCTVALAFNMLKEAKHPTFDPGELVDFMSGVQRIVPRGL